MQPAACSLQRPQRLGALTYCLLLQLLMFNTSTRHLQRSMISESDTGADEEKRDVGIAYVDRFLKRHCIRRCALVSCALLTALILSSSAKLGEETSPRLDCMPAPEHV